MPAFFAHKRGSVVRIASKRGNNSGLLPFRIIMANMDMTSQRTRAIVTNAAIVENGNYQFLHTLNETIYAYIFGDRIGELRVSGVCFSHNCDGTPSGMKQMIDNYRRNRLSAIGQSTQVSFGETDYKGFLVGTNMEVNDPEQMLGQWTLRFNTFPGNQ